MTIHITDAQVKAISLGFGKVEICNAVASSVNEHGSKFQVDTPMRMKHFLGQCCIESSFYQKLEESLYYSEQRLIEVWPNRFNKSNASQYARNPQKLANFTYGGRMGNDGPNDGWLYRGSSIKQMTGHDNFYLFNKWIHGYFPGAPDFVQNPDYARTLEWAVWPAFWYWSTQNCAYYADRDDSKGLTRAINGGLIMLAERVKATAVAAKVLAIQTDPVVTTSAPKQPDPLLKEMQGKLTELAKVLKKPELDPKGIDGWNGKNTENAVKAVQALTKIYVDGKCGPNTRKAINMLCEKYGVAR
jgi:putative chitinase